MESSKFSIGDIIFFDHLDKEEAGIIESYGMGVEEMTYVIRIISNSITRNMTVVKKESQLRWKRKEKKD